MPAKNKDKDNQQVRVHWAQQHARLRWMRSVYSCPTLKPAEVGDEDLVVVRADLDDVRWLDAFRTGDGKFLGRFHRLGRTGQ
jgi:hypothetical protein